MMSSRDGGLTIRSLRVTAQASRTYVDGDGSFQPWNEQPVIVVPYAAVQIAYPNDVSIDFFQSLGFGSSRDVTLYATAAYLGGSPSTWDVTIPDLSAAGYNATWGLTAGTAVSWMVSATNFREVGGPLPNGGQYAFAIRGSADASLIALRAVPQRPSFARVLRPRMSRFAAPVRPRR